LPLFQRAVEKIKEVKDKGIPIYLTYGSHDFAPNSISIIDILNSTGLFKKVVEAEVTDEKIQLRFVTDSRTGAKIAGLSGRRLGLEKKYFEMLDSENLESEAGFKIFVFHNAIIELRTQQLPTPKVFQFPVFQKALIIMRRACPRETEARCKGLRLSCFSRLPVRRDLY